MPESFARNHEKENTTPALENDRLVMCRIVGIWDFRERKQELTSILRSMRDAMAHGGPDHAGEFVDPENSLALGHRRLSIIDLTEASNQPFSSGHMKMVYNGECYNYRDLRKSLEQSIQLKTESDTEVILESIIQNGWPAVNSFRGMFAFAIWDGRARRLTLCRDRLGVKPLYWYFHDDLFMFASELKAFHRHPDFDKSIDHAALSKYLRTGFIESPYSIFKFVRKLEPGQILSINADKTMEKQTYWSARNAFESVEADHRSEEDLVELLDEKLTESVMLRTVSDVPIGMFLSGGIDSTMTAAILNKNHSQQIKTFTIGFSDRRFNEAPQAQSISNYLNTDHHELICNENDFMEVVAELPEILDEPMADASIIPTALVSRLAREHVKVVLSGDGGDELFGGYTKYVFSKNEFKKLQRIPLPLRRAMSKLLKAIDRPATAKLLEISPFSKRYRNFSSKFKKYANSFDATSLEKYFSDVSSYITGADLLKLQTNGLLTVPMKTDVAENRIVSYLGLMDICCYLKGDILCKVDRATMRVGLEGREPLLDHELLEFAFSIPDHLKIRRGETKYLLRRVLENYVPRELTDRPKAGFEIPVAKWLRSTFLGEVALMANDDRFVEVFRFDQPYLQRMVDNFVKGHGNANPYLIWFLFVLYRWFKRWLA